MIVRADNLHGAILLWLDIPYRLIVHLCRQADCIKYSTLLIVVCAYIILYAITAIHCSNVKAYFQEHELYVSHNHVGHLQVQSVLIPLK